jgi:hypothetical protein
MWELDSSINFYPDKKEKLKWQNKKMKNAVLHTIIGSTLSKQYLSP